MATATREAPTTPRLILNLHKYLDHQVMRVKKKGARQKGNQRFRARIKVPRRFLSDKAWKLGIDARAILYLTVTKLGPKYRVDSNVGAIERRRRLKINFQP